MDETPAWRATSWMVGVCRRCPLKDRPHTLARLSVGVRARDTLPKSRGLCPSARATTLVLCRRRLAKGGVLGFDIVIISGDAQKLGWSVSGEQRSKDVGGPARRAVLAGA